MPQVTVRFPDELYEDLQEFLADEQQFTDQSEATRYAVRALLQREMPARSDEVDDDD